MGKAARLHREADFQQQIIDAAHYLGWRCAHFILYHISKAGHGIRATREEGLIVMVQDEMKEPTLITMEEAELSTKQALSANNAKWREKIEEHNGFCDLGGGINICITEEQWQSILSQMEGE